MAAEGNDRREFLKMGGAALASTAVSWNARSYAAVIGANDRVKVGIIGFGDRMRGGDIPAFQKHAKEMNFEIVAVSDIWSRQREAGGPDHRRAPGHSNSVAADSSPGTAARFPEARADSRLSACAAAADRATADASCRAWSRSRRTAARRW